MLTEIKEKLKEIDSNVQVGICVKKNDSWNCLLVRKEALQKGQHDLSNSFRVSVRIIREDEIEKGTEKIVIDKMREAGWKRTDTTGKYEYTIDANEVIVETCKLEFAKTIKGCG